MPLSLAALLPLVSADAEHARPAAAEVEPVSLLGDTLRHPALDAAARARFEAQRDAARGDFARPRCLSRGHDRVAQPGHAGGDGELALDDDAPPRPARRRGLRARAELARHDVIENGANHQLLLLYKGELPADSLLSPAVPAGARRASALEGHA